MLGVIREAAIGHHTVTEKKRKSIWQAAAWFLERRYPEKYSQRKIVEGELPKDIPYEVFMTAKLLLQLPKTELQRITDALRETMRPRVIADNTGDAETGSK